MVGQTAGLGVALTLLVAALFWNVFGDQAVLGSVAFGITATVIHVVAMRLAGPLIGKGDFNTFMSRWAVGMGLRLAGVVGVAVAVAVDRVRFPPLSTALGYLAVVVPLLFFEMRRFR